MPRASHPCAQPGCPEMVTTGSYCTEHETARRHTDPDQARFYRSSWWTKRSRSYRQQHPVCEVVGCCRPSKITDHIDGDWQNNPDDDSNYQALCLGCNRTKTAREHRAKVGGR